MKFDLTKVLLDLRDGAPFIVSQPVPGEYAKDANGEILTVQGRQVAVYKDHDLTLQLAAGEALAQWGQSENLTVSIKRMRGKLIERIFENPKEVELTVQDEALIIERIGMIYGPLVLIRAESEFEIQKQGKNTSEEKIKAVKSV